ncbi:beta-sarcoglycan [Phyllopteryx taeniolatus]|uniref:beta-sarcoglycan n=1 Tax=Phyllopteryx taeniolatus TaxID=161469 RepID=UPI002AD524A8|nr:beta-sarcoglycan [Phyllopteryx taeniolatus]
MFSQQKQASLNKKSNNAVKSGTFLLHTPVGKRGRLNMASEQESANGPVKKSMREKAIERRGANKEHNSNFRAGYVPIEEERLHKTGLRGRKGNMAVCVIVLLFLLALINLIITLVIWTVIRIGPNGCDSMEFHESGLLRFKQKADMGVVHPLHKSTVGGRKDQDLHIVGNNNPVVFQQGTSKLSVEKDKTSVVSDTGISFTDPRTQTTFFSTDYENHEFHLPKGVKVLSVKKASTERITSSAASDLNIRGDGKAIIRGNEGVNIMGRTVEFKMGGDIELRAENSIVLNGSVMFNATRIPNSAGDVYFDEGVERYKLCMCADGTLFRVQVKYPNMGCQTSDNPCRNTHQGL